MLTQTHTCTINGVGIEEVEHRVLSHLRLQRDERHRTDVESELKANRMGTNTWSEPAGDKVNNIGFSRDRATRVLSQPLRSTMSLLRAQRREEYDPIGGGSGAGAGTVCVYC